eukprot:7416150-Alexandrium_andersonii.AAC.1
MPCSSLKLSFMFSKPSYLRPARRIDAGRRHAVKGRRANRGQTLNTTTNCASEKRKPWVGGSA